MRVSLVSNIYYGPRQQVMLEVSNMTVCRDIDNMYQIWHTPTDPPKHIVFINDSDISLADFKPRPDRHLALIDQDKIPTNISKWATKHKAKITLKKVLNPTRDQLFQVMISGKIGITFTKEAADLLLNLRPRGLQSLYWPLEQLKDLDVQEPVTCDGLMGQWPISNEVDIYNLFKSLGSVQAMTLADKVSPKKAWGGLYMLANLCKSRPVYLEYLELVQEHITSKKLRPQTALKLFTRLCYLDRQGLDIQEVFS